MRSGFSIKTRALAGTEERERERKNTHTWTKNAIRNHFFLYETIQIYKIIVVFCHFSIIRISGSLCIMKAIIDV